MIVLVRGPLSMRRTRLSAGIMRPQVSAAMVEGSQFCVGVAELQAAQNIFIAEGDKSRRCI
jgi:hypothetical protein